jgi:hypothetical protein
MLRGPVDLITRFVFYFLLAPKIQGSIQGAACVIFLLLLSFLFLAASVMYILGMAEILWFSELAVLRASVMQHPDLDGCCIYVTTPSMRITYFIAAS